MNTIRKSKVVLKGVKAIIALRLILIGMVITSSLLVASGCESGCENLIEELMAEIESPTNITPTGGTIKVTSASSSLKGVSVEIPEGALEEEVNIEIKVAPKSVSIPEGFVSAGTGIEVRADTTIFNYPVSITLPYLEQGINEDTVGVYRYNPDNGSWKITPLESIDTTRNTITVQTFTLSLFYPLALGADTQIAGQSSAILFDPNRDKLDTPNIENCYGEAAFVQWYWDNKAGHLMDWNRNRHWEIAEMAHCTTWRENNPSKYRHSRDRDGIVAISLMLSLDRFPRPQIVGYTFQDSKGHAGGHIILVYGYRTINTAPIEVEFYIYDSEVPNKKAIMAYDGQFLHYHGNGHINGFVHIVTPNDTDALEFVYEYINKPPEITDITPTGEINDKRPTISASIYYPFIAPDRFAYQPKVEMRLNDNTITPTIELIDEHNIRVSYTPPDDLPPGLYHVYLAGESYYSRDKTGKGFCAPPKEEKDWTFIIGGDGWCFTFYPKLPAIYIHVNPVEVYYVNVDAFGQPAPYGMDLDFNQIPELASLAQLWYAPLPEETICIPVTRDGTNISATFKFIHPVTGHEVTGELIGTITGTSVRFDINYYLPAALQNFTMPLNYSDCLSDMEGAVSYSLPAVFAAHYIGTMTGDTIKGSFTTTITDIWACWRYHDKEYACAWGVTREEMNFDGIVEWTFSNLRMSGDFKVDIRHTDEP